jgi:hypothetical protein
MGYRRKAKQEHSANRSWDEWLACYGPDLLGCGVSPVVLKDESHWWDFLQHGLLDHHDDPTGFSTDDVAPDQAARLVELLESMLPASEWNSAFALLQLRDIAGDPRAGRRR